MTTHSPISATASYDPSSPSDLGLPLLTAEQERQASSTTLIRHNLRLARHLASREVYQRRGIEREDLEQIAYIGLIVAARRWRPDAGVRFSSYAGEVIKSHLLRAIHDQGRTIRLPVWLQERLPQLRRAEAVLCRQFGRAPTNDELALHLGWPVHHIEVLQDSEEPDSLDAAASMGGRAQERERHEVTPAPNDTAEEAITRIEAEHLHAALERLPERWREIVLALHPLDGSPGLTMRQAGQRFGLSYERVRQLKDLAFAQLRRDLARLRPETHDRKDFTDDP